MYEKIETAVICFWLLVPVLMEMWDAIERRREDRREAGRHGDSEI